jgi:hypothetical protein
MAYPEDSAKKGGGAPQSNGDSLTDFLIHAYSRSQAIEDGVLIDATATAREAGIRYPVALTATQGLAG